MASPSKTSIIVKPSLKKLKQRFKAAQKRLENDNTPFKQAATFLSAWVSKNFKAQGAMGADGKWQKLAAGGRSVKRGKLTQLDTSAKILQDTGRLRASFFPFIHGARFKDSKDAGVGSDLIYSAVHNEGLNGIPVRRILPRGPEVQKQIDLIFGMHVKTVGRHLTNE